VKIAICIPTYGDTKAAFTASLAMMIQETLKQLPAVEFHVFMISSSILIQARTQLFLEAVKWQADYLLWLDADHIFPQNAVTRLLSRARDVVGVNYPRRDISAEPTAFRSAPADMVEMVWTTADKRDADLVEEVEYMGLGLVLINMRAMRRLGPSPLPLFHMEARSDGTYLGEDVFFFRKLRSVGIGIFVDHSLSWEIGHIVEHRLTNADADAARNGRSESLRSSVKRALDSPKYANPNKSA
jgi:hypothetical protein